MNICVYCSSRNEGSAPYIEAAAELGKWIAKEGHTLVYGGATGGLMDAVANAVHEENGNIIGVIPELIKKNGRLSPICTKLIEVKDMSERKDVMQDISDIFVVLPGGIGTIDELFDTISKVSLKYFVKKTILVNLNNYWSGIIYQIGTMTNEKLGYTSNFLLVANDIDQTIAILKEKIINQ